MSTSAHTSVHTTAIAQLWVSADYGSKNPAALVPLARSCSFVIDLTWWGGVRLISLRCVCVKDKIDKSRTYYCRQLQENRFQLRGSVSETRGLDRVDRESKTECVPTLRHNARDLRSRRRQSAARCGREPCSTHCEVRGELVQMVPNALLVPDASTKQLES